MYTTYSGTSDSNLDACPASCPRLLLALERKAEELGTSLSASFEGFGADEDGRLSAEQLHKALKDIGTFRWTTVSKFRAFLLTFSSRINRCTFRLEELPAQRESLFWVERLPRSKRSWSLFLDS